MIYSGPGFIAVIYDLAPPPPLLPPPVSKLDWRHTGRLIDNLLKGVGEGVGERAISYDGEKAWSSINHSILSGVRIKQGHLQKTHFEHLFAVLCKYEP
jgi:hypothetical protein